MIQCILERLFTLNYFTDQQGIIKRYMAEKDNWQPHLNHCKEFILNSVPFTQKLNVAVLGSGWLLDVPGSELLQMHHLTLIDINHPRQVKHKLTNQQNVSFIEKDLTFGLVSKARQSKSLDDFFIYLKNTEILDDLADFDFVISVNLLNQLDILLVDLLKNKFHIEAEQLNFIRKKIQDNHVHSLPKGKSILISDWIEMSINDSNSVVDSISLIFTNLLNGKEYQKWTWVFDTKKNYRCNYSTSFEVRAFKL